MRSSPRLPHALCSLRSPALSRPAFEPPPVLERPKQMAQRLRSFMHQQKGVQLREDAKRALPRLSPALQVGVSHLSPRLSSHVSPHTCPRPRLC